MADDVGKLYASGGLAAANGLMICKSLAYLKHRFYGPVFPRLFGCAISTDSYTPAYLDAIARMDMTVVNFYPGASVGPRFVVSELKRRNPGIKVYIYTDLNDQIDSPAWDTVMHRLSAKNEWLLKDQQRIPAWGGKSFYCNLQTPSWPFWMAEYCDETFIKGSGADGWYCDCVQEEQRVPVADFNGTGDIPVTPEISATYRHTYALAFDRIRQLSRLPVMGNCDNDLSSPEYQGALEGAYLEGLMGYSWSLIHQGWDAVMARYRGSLRHTSSPHTVVFNVAGAPADFKLFRFAYTSCLLHDGYFSFSGANGNYGVVPWFKEYEIQLGRALDEHITPYQSGVYRRRFQHGTVYCNPTKTTQTVDGHVIAAEDGVIA